MGADLANKGHGVALVLQGGGSRGAFTAGVLDVFMKNGIHFDYIVGTSAGALSAMNYISEDIGRSKLITTDLIRNKRFLSVRNRFTIGSVFNFDYLFNEVQYLDGYSFNHEKYLNSEVVVEAVATSFKTGEVVYFRKEKGQEKYKCFQASSSLPLISRPVDVDGEKYLDGGVVAAVPWKRPFELGFKKEIIVLTRKIDYTKGKTKRLKRFLNWLFYHRHKAFYKSVKSGDDSYNSDYDNVRRLKESGEALVIAPLELKSHIKATETSEEVLTDLYNKGVQVATGELENIKKFLNGNE